MSTPQNYINLETALSALGISEDAVMREFNRYKGSLFITKEAMHALLDQKMEDMTKPADVCPPGYKQAPHKAKVKQAPRRVRGTFSYPDAPAGARTITFSAAAAELKITANAIENRVKCLKLQVYCEVYRNNIGAASKRRCILLEDLPRIAKPCFHTLGVTSAPDGGRFLQDIADELGVPRDHMYSSAVYYQYPLHKCKRQGHRTDVSYISGADAAKLVALYSSKTK